MSRDDVCQMAKNLARTNGFSVFPVGVHKKPTCPNGFYDAAIDPEAIERLWRHHPGVHIGVATGAISGIDVLDCDTGDWAPNEKPAIVKKHQGARFWWHENFRRLPPTRIYGTRSGGLHLVFQHRDSVTNTQSKIHPGIDSRGDGGYAIWWWASGFPCHCHEPPAQWPSWLFDLLIEPIVPPAPVRSRSTTIPVQHYEAFRIKLMATLSAAPEGTKHSTLIRITRSLGGIQAAAEFTDDEAIGWIRNALPDTVKDWAAAERTARWGLASGRAAPLDLRAAG